MKKREMRKTRRKEKQGYGNFSQLAHPLASEENKQ